MLNPIAPWITAPNAWSVVASPAVATQATVTKAAAGAGLRNVCDSVCFSIANTNAALGQFTYGLVRDGASGVGPVIWQGLLAQITASGGSVSQSIAVSGLGVVGSANTAMCFETSSGPGASNYQSIAATGHVQP